jgi:NADH-quinone oxidoreductase subunit F
VKWSFIPKDTGKPVYVVCNADEGEPGTFKDRLIMEHRPHELLEGVLIACETVGAREALIYLREEYVLARLALEAAIAEAKHGGIVRDGHLKPWERMDADGDPAPALAGLGIRIVIGAGAYVCGEETALLESIEGKRGEPRLKPPFPATHGLWQRPTLINNVETLAAVPGILRDGPEEFKSKGVRGNAGTRLFSISGHVESADVYELPIGTTVAEAIKKAGGVIDGKRLKAFMPGGVSSGFLPATMSETPLDFDSLAKVGSMGGSGAIIVVAEGTCMVDLATSCLRFFAHESCGKCTPCRVGTEKMKNMAEENRVGKTALDIGLVTELGETMALASICGLGQTAYLPLTSAMKHFPGEFTAHASGNCLETRCRF